MPMSDFKVSVSEGTVRVRHKPEGHSYKFERVGRDALSDSVTVTTNYDSTVFASSLAAEARKAAQKAILG